MLKLNPFIFHHIQIFSLIFWSSVKTKELLESHRSVLKILQSENYSSNLIPPVPPCNSVSPDFSSCSKKPLKVFLNLGLRDIEAIDDKSMELKLQLSIRQKWKDPRLQFQSQDPHDYVTLNADTIHKPWTPDIFIHNEKYSTVHSVTRPNSFIRIFPDGRIFQSTGLSLTLSCFMNLARLPFDKQTCDIQLSSYSYSNDTLELDWDDHESLEQIVNIEDQDFTQFRLKGHRTGGCVMKNMFGLYSAIFMQFDFQRQMAYYISQVYVPCTMLTIITWVTFWLGDAMEARLSLTVTVLLTLQTQISGTMQTLPQVSYNTGLGTFTGICLTFAVMSILETATVFYFMRGEGIGLRRWRTTKIVDFMAKMREKKTGANGSTKGGSVEETVGECEEVQKSDGSFVSGRIDKISRILFPGAFASSVMMYFVYYLFLWEWEVSKEESGRDDQCNHAWAGWKPK